VPVLLDWTDYALEYDPQILAGIEAIRSGDAET
jgi:hypothetical protein